MGKPKQLNFVFFWFENFLDELINRALCSVYMNIFLVFLSTEVS